MITRTPTQIKHREDRVVMIRYMAYEAYCVAVDFWPSAFINGKGSIFNTLDKVKTI